MRLAEIMMLALRQLDEDPADISEYDDLFRRYANEGYQIVMRDIYKPREKMLFFTDEDGKAMIGGMDIVRVISLTTQEGRDVWFNLSVDGEMLYTREKEKELYAVVEKECGMLLQESDVPAFPEWAHSALADYICYRHLSAGNMGKQQRAQFYLNQFYQTIRRIRPQGTGSVTRYRNLYEVTDARYRG